MFHRSALLALTAASALVAPVSAAEESEYAGFSCGFTSTNDPTGVVNQDPNVQFGEMSCGPWLAYELFEEPSSTPPTVDDNPELSHITIRGCIQVNNATPSGPCASGGQAAEAMLGAHCEFSGDGGAGGACTVDYTASATDNVFLCTVIQMLHDNGTVTTFTFDEDDNPANGFQCSLATSAGA